MSSIVWVQSPEPQTWASPEVCCWGEGQQAESWLQDTALPGQHAQLGCYLYWTQGWKMQAKGAHDPNVTNQGSVCLCQQ